MLGARRQIAPDHRAHNPVGGGIGPLEGTHMRAVAQHGNAVAQSEYFRHPVRHVEQRHPPTLGLIQDAEQVIRLGVGQGCRRLVEHEDSAIERQRPGDLQQLPVGGRQRLDWRVGGDRQVQPRQQCLGPLAHRCMAQPADTA